MVFGDAGIVPVMSTVIRTYAVLETVVETLAEEAIWRVAPRSSSASFILSTPISALRRRICTRRSLIGSSRAGALEISRRSRKGVGVRWVDFV